MSLDNVNMWPWVDRIITAGIFLTPIVSQLWLMHRQNRKQIAELIRCTKQFKRKFSRHERKDRRVQKKLKLALQHQVDADNMASSNR